MVSCRHSQYFNIKLPNFIVKCTLIERGSEAGLQFARHIALTSTTMYKRGKRKLTVSCLGFLCAPSPQLRPPSSLFARPIPIRWKVHTFYRINKKTLYLRNDSEFVYKR
jgi:hypothetical protein